MCSYLDYEFEKVITKYKSNNPYDLIKEAHIKLLYADLDDETGGCTQSNSRCHTIIVNINWPEWYQRFVILHEFSHLMLHKGASTPFFRRLGLNSFVSKMEYEANTLAMKLLIYMQNEEELSGLTKYQITDYLGLPKELAAFI